ncbi:extracellular solute-binding protein [uncultured Microbacterium sp.]|uniref:sugar ABC transporter substrate-binding protein n=1 Tax=uncultured Microbacterium sp. TaxID=191216 RepID=UPI0025D43529|nr:extracellular solute-binding protein [uncultured Microbacterium sp.]
MTRHSTRAAIGAGALVLVGAIALTGCGSGFSGGGADSTTGATKLTSSDKPLNILIGSSGDAETDAVKAAVADWSKTSGISATVTAASDLNQQLSQGFASGSPADVFYQSTDSLAGYASNGSLLAYGDLLKNKDDFYPSLQKSFTYDGKLYCAPKDFSTLQLIINTDMWAKAGLTDADVPKTWDELATVSKKLTADGHVGLAMSGEYARVGAFMVAAGGGLMNADSTKATADAPGNVKALDYLKGLLDAGSMKFAADLGSGWGGEAFGTQKAAMVVEGNWITGAMGTDYPTVKYKAVELPAGPDGKKGTLQFTNCWGIAADSKNQKAALDLVEHLTSAESQLAFSKAFGPMPSIRSAADEWKTDNAALVPFLDGAEYAQGMPTAKGASDVVTDFNGKLGSLATGDPTSMLATAQKNLEALTK